MSSLLLCLYDSLFFVFVLFAANDFQLESDPWKGVHKTIRKLQKLITWNSEKDALHTYTPEMTERKYNW
jgi:hypothetical protein